MRLTASRLLVAANILLWTATATAARRPRYGGSLRIEVLRSTGGVLDVCGCGAFGGWLIGASGSGERGDSGIGSAWRSRTFDGADGETGC